MRKSKIKPKAAKPARIGANREMQMAEKRANMPSIVKRAALRLTKVVVCLALVCGIVFSIVKYGPVLTDKISGAVKSGSKLASDVRITGCSLPVQASLMRAIDSMTCADSSSFCREGILKVALAIPEIENINVKKIKGMADDKTTLIAVTERKPVAMVHNGAIFLVDKKGVCFSPTPGRFYDLPLLAVGAVSPGDTVNLELFNTVKKTAKNLGVAFFRDISEIDLSKSSEVNLFFRSGGTEYKVSARDVETRLVHVKALKEKLTVENGKQTKIDLRYRNLAFITDK